MEKSKLQLYIRTSEGLDEPDLAIQLWNGQSSPEMFFGGVSELQIQDGHRRHVIRTRLANDRRETDDPYVAYIRRLPASNEEKELRKPYTGRVRAIAIRKDRGRVDLGLILFVNQKGDRKFLSGFFNPNGLVVDKQGRVDTSVEGTLSMTGDLWGTKAETLLNDLEKNSRKRAS